MDAEAEAAELRAQVEEQQGAIADLKKAFEALEEPDPLALLQGFFQICYRTLLFLNLCAERHCFSFNNIHSTALRGESTLTGARLHEQHGMPPWRRIYLVFGGGIAAPQYQQPWSVPNSCAFYKAYKEYERCVTITNSGQTVLRPVLKLSQLLP